MFEKSLQEKFSRIFGIEKVTFDAPTKPGEDKAEQECMFINVETPRFIIRPGIQKAMVTGKCMVRARAEKMPFGFFAKAIQEAGAAETKDLLFFDIEENTPSYRDIVWRAFSFTYFFSSQYDPAVGTLNQLTVNIEEH